jgi:hypothetical protein
MKRNDYKLLVENWNSYLVKEEKRIINENLLIESFLLKEFNIKKFATKLKNKLNNPYISVPALVLFVGAKLANATPLEIAENPKLMPGDNVKIAAFFDGASNENIAEYVEGAQAVGGSLIVSDTQVDKLVATIFLSTGSGKGSDSGTTQSGEIMGRTISLEEQNVINLLKLFDNNPDAFKEAIKDVKNQALLCSFGYCYGEWKEDGKNRYELYSPLGYTFIEMKGDNHATGVDPVPKGKAVEIHTKNNRPPKDDYIKKLKAQYQPLLSKKSAKVRKFGESLNQLVIMYQLGWKAAVRKKIEKAEKSIPKLIETFKSDKGPNFKGDLMNSFENCVQQNEKAYIEGLKESYRSSISILLESNRLTAKSARLILGKLEKMKSISDILIIGEINDDISRGFLIKIFGGIDFDDIERQINDESKV